MAGEIDLTVSGILLTFILFSIKKLFDIDKRLAKVETKMEIFLNGKRDKDI